MGAVSASARLLHAGIPGRKSCLGAFASGAPADLIAVAGNPLNNLGLLQEQGRRFKLIVRNGTVFKCGA